MNKKIQTTCIGLSLAAATITSSIAGEEQSLAMTSSPSGQAYDWSWFAGGSVGYVDGDWGLGAVGSAIDLDEWQEPIYTIHLGLERRNAGEDFSHAFFLELGLTDSDSRASATAPTADVVDAFDTINDFYQFSDLSGQEAINDVFGITSPSNDTNITIEFTTDVEIIPITLNYKFEAQGGGNFSWYMGGGLGFALVDVKLSGSLSTDDPGAATPELSESYSFDDTVYYAQIFAGLTYNFSESTELFAGARYIFMDDIDVDDLNTSIDSPLDGAVHYEVGLRYNF